MNQNGLHFVSIALSCTACAVAAVALSRSGHPPVAASAAEPDDARIQAIACETAALRSDLDRFASRPLEASPSQRTMVEPTVLPPELLKRLDGLEESVAALQRRRAEGAPRAEAAPNEPPDLVDARRRATDAAASEAERLAALRTLRGQKIAGQNAISTDVLLSMLDLGEHSPNEATRTDVYRNLHRIVDPSLRDSMLRALTNDPSALVREQVAKDIDTFLPDPAVEAALRRAADGDPDPKVRAAALKTLASQH